MALQLKMTSVFLAEHFSVDLLGIHMYFDSFFVYSVSIETGFRLASISHIFDF